MTNNNIYSAFDLVKLGLLPNDWVEQVKQVVSQHAVYTQLDGTSSTSRERVTGQAIDVFVVMGDKIKDNLPWLYSLYTNQLCKFASSVAGRAVNPSTDLRSSININVLRGKGSRYEWHVDSNPLTGLLFVTTHPSEEGGELIFEHNNSSTLVNPKAGMFIAFDAREIPHTVLSLKIETTRISIPMNYYHSDNQQARPDDLDSYLYKTEQSKIGE